jgi:myb proto-oncogene protein
LDNLIITTAEENERCWAVVSKIVKRKNPGMRKLNAKKIRERYMNHLNPSLKKSSWDEFEDAYLYQQVSVHGKKWAKIAMGIEGRNEHQVKNRWN